VVAEEERSEWAKNVSRSAEAGASSRGVFVFLFFASEVDLDMVDEVDANEGSPGSLTVSVDESDTAKDVLRFLLVVVVIVGADVVVGVFDEVAVDPGVNRVVAADDVAADTVGTDVVGTDVVVSTGVADRVVPLPRGVDSSSSRSAPKVP
jgi:hypothetical protein